MDIRIPNEQNIAGQHPVIIIGPNGSGKTTFGSELATLNNAEWIPATRNLEFSEEIPMQTSEQAENSLKTSKTQQRNDIWRQANDLISLLAKLKAEDSASAIAFKRSYRSGERTDPPLTKIEQLASIWNSLFPKREIDFSSYSPKVKAGHRSTSTPFAIGKMSGGERVALYLLAKIIDAPSGIIVIDEPEVHFHGVLARKFWNTLETLRKDCRFVYITHDLPFAVSRDNGQFIIVTSETERQILPPQTNITDEIIESVLGAATFSITAKNFLFCEGSKFNKKDDGLYSAWLEEDDTVVIPVGSCEQVIKCVEVFNRNEAIKGLTAKGIIDRDFRSDDFLGNLPANIHALDLHEIESIYCTETVFKAIAKYLGKNEADAGNSHLQFIAKAKKHFTDNHNERNKIVLERTKQRTEEQAKKLLNRLGTEENIDVIKAKYLEALNMTNWPFSPETFFDEERQRIENALTPTASINDLLRLFPGKILLSLALGELHMTQNDFLNLAISALNIPSNDDIDALKVLKSDLPIALESHKPFRL